MYNIDKGNLDWRTLRRGKNKEEQEMNHKLVTTSLLDLVERNSNIWFLKNPNTF